MSPQATLSLAIAQASRYFVRLEMPTSAGIFIRLSFLLLNLTVTLDDKFLRAESGEDHVTVKDVLRSTFVREVLSIAPAIFDGFEQLLPGCSYNAIIAWSYSVIFVQSFGL